MRIRSRADYDGKTIIATTTYKNGRGLATKTPNPKKSIFFIMPKKSISSYPTPMIVLKLNNRFKFKIGKRLPNIGSSIIRIMRPAIVVLVFYIR